MKWGKPLPTKLKHNLMRLNRRPFITYAILIINIAMFLLMEITGSSQNVLTLVQFGAKSNLFIAAGEWWRLITPMFLHIGVVHLIMNSLIIYFLGMQLEEIYGHLRFTLIYLFSGIFGNILSFAFNDAISAGASTAVFGLFMTTLVLANERPNNPAIQAIARNYRILIIINIIFNLFDAGVDLAGHLGGLAGGFLVAKALTKTNDKDFRLSYMIVYVVAAIILFYIGYQGTISRLF